MRSQRTAAEMVQLAGVDRGGLVSVERPVDLARSKSLWPESGDLRREHPTAATDTETARGVWSPAAADVASAQVPRRTAGVGCRCTEDLRH